MKRSTVALLIVLSVGFLLPGCRDHETAPASEPTASGEPFASPALQIHVNSPGAFHNDIVRAYLARRPLRTPWRGWDDFFASFAAAANEAAPKYDVPPVITANDIRATIEFYRRLAVEGVCDVTNPTLASLYRYIEFQVEYGYLSRDDANAEHRVVQIALSNGIRAAIADATKTLAQGIRSQTGSEFGTFVDIVSESDVLWNSIEVGRTGEAGTEDSPGKRAATRIIDGIASHLAKSKNFPGSIIGSAIASTLFEEAWNHSGDFIHWPPPPCPTCFPCQPLPCSP